MTELKQIAFHVDEAWRDALNKICQREKLNRSELIRNAVERVIREKFGVALPGEVGPHGVRNDYK